MSTTVAATALISPDQAAAEAEAAQEARDIAAVALHGARRRHTRAHPQGALRSGDDGAGGCAISFNDGRIA